MGKLRDSLTGLKTVLGSVEKRLQDAEQEAARLDTNLNSRFEAGIKAGAEVLYQYLLEKFKAEGSSYSAHLKDTLMQHKDANVLKFVTGIAAGKADVMKIFAEWESFIGRDVKAIQGDVARIHEYAGDVAKQIAKKKKKLLQSSKYKAKIAGYAQALDDVLVTAKTLDEAADAFRPCMNKKGVDSIKLAVTTTLGDLSEDSLLVSLKAEMKNAEEALKNGVKTRRKFREGGDLKGAAAMFAKWVDDADDMEQEAEDEEDTSEAPKVDPAPKMKDIVVKQGSTVIANGKAGEYELKSKLLTTELVWSKKASDPLDYLQKKLLVEAKYAQDGKDFHVDVKLDKLGGGLTKATFKVV